eukprot:maker-scaffold40_size501252-snap-gene-2.14 protein:Tk06162 transcript:maker-scaffold40_size501252-snap-gene-2.14-mRNA-1 annotation:"hypothetical protein DAPPUDRAFT_311738"
MENLPVTTNKRELDQGSIRSINSHHIEADEEDPLPELKPLDKNVESAIDKMIKGTNKVHSENSKKDVKNQVATSETDSMSNSNSVVDHYITVDEKTPSWVNPNRPGKIPTTFNVMPEQSRKLSYSLSDHGNFGEAFHRWKTLEDAEVKDSQLLQDETATSFFSKFRKKPRSKKRRVCEKGGDANVQYKNISKKKRRYLTDIYTTLVDSSWGLSLTLFAGSFYLTWSMYAVFYYTICYFHGDFEPDHLPDKQAESGWIPCIWAIDSIYASFLFSLETQHTIGYGTRQTSTECPMAMAVMSTQSVLGCLIQAFMVGLVFAKLSTPNKRARTVVFSKNAVISERDKKMCFAFRVGDMRPDSFIVGAHISAKLIRRRVTAEGEMFHDVSPFKILPDSSAESCMFLIWPITVYHVIDEESPFYKLSASEFRRAKFEVHVVLEGTIEATSMIFQARTSYLPDEIFWGHRFEPMMIYRKDHNRYQVNFSAFNSTYEVDTALCSARDLDNYKNNLLSRSQSNNKSDPKKSKKPSIIANSTVPNVKSMVSFDYGHPKHPRDSLSNHSGSQHDFNSKFKRPSFTLYPEDEEDEKSSECGTDDESKKMPWEATTRPGSTHPSYSGGHLGGHNPIPGVITPDQSARSHGGACPTTRASSCIDVTLTSQDLQVGNWRFDDFAASDHQLISFEVEGSGLPIMARPLQHANWKQFQDRYRLAHHLPRVRLAPFEEGLEPETSLIGTRMVTIVGITEHDVATKLNAHLRLIVDLDKFTATEFLELLLGLERLIVL